MAAVQANVHVPVLRCVDACAADALSKWGGGSEPSDAALKSLRELYAVAREASPVVVRSLRQRPRLRLLALTTKVLGLLGHERCGNIDLPAIVASLAPWAAEVSIAIDEDAADEEVARGMEIADSWAEELCAARDAAGPDAAGSQTQIPCSAPIAPGIRPAEVARVISNLISSAQFVNSHVLPPPESVDVVSEDRSSRVVCEDGIASPFAAAGGSQRSSQASCNSQADVDDAGTGGEESSGYAPARSRQRGHSKAIRASSEPYSTTAAPAAALPAASSREVPASVSTQVVKAGADAPASATDGSWLQVRSSAKAAASASRDDLFYGGVPEKLRMSWTDEEERRLIEGQRIYGNQWETIRAKCDLRHRYGTQLREKMRNLNRARAV